MFYWAKNHVCYINGRKKVLIRNYSCKFARGLATKNPPLGSLLGTYGIPADPFCEVFNKASIQLWPSGTLIPIVIVISPTKTYIIE